jgi:hypothetical protein
VRRLVTAAVVTAITIPTLGSNAAWAVGTTVPGPGPTAIVGEQGPSCDPINDSAIADEIAALKAQIAQLEASRRALLAEIYERSKVTARLQGEVASAWNALMAWDRQLEIYNRWRNSGPGVGTPGQRVPLHPESMYGPRADLLHAWMLAQINLRKEYAVIEEIRAELRGVNADLDRARMRLAELGLALGNCADQPAPPAPPI